MTLDTVDGATFDSFATSLIVMAKAHPPLINPNIIFMLNRLERHHIKYIKIRLILHEQECK